MKARDFTVISILISLSFVLSLIKLFNLPNGGAVTFYLVPLMIIAFKFSFKQTLLACIVAGILQVLVGVVTSPLQAFFDYILPLCSISLFVFAKEGYKYYMMALLVTVITLLCNSISGVMFFGVSFIYAFIYNCTHFIPTILLSIIATNIIKKRVTL